jgi:putative transposase
MVYLTNLAQLLAKTACALHAYCLMTNHVHLLLTPPRVPACATLMRNLGQRYAQYFNRRYDRTGGLWEGRYRSCLVDSPAYVLACYRYIERNPVRAEMVSAPADYRWSSFGGNAGRASNRLLTPHVEYLALAADDGSRQRAYSLMLDQPDDPSLLRAIREATNGGLALIGATLRAELEAQSGRRLEHRKPGPAPADKAALDTLTRELGL